MKTKYMFTKACSVFFFAALTLISVNSFSQSWAALGTGVNGTINAAIVYNGALIVAGDFTTAGGNPANHIAQWNGTTWSALGTGTDSAVNALTIFNNQLVAVGKFINAGGVACNRVARWNGTTWASLGLGCNGEIKCALVYANYLRVGGLFTTAGGVTCNRVARWDGTAWSAFLGNNNGANNEVDAMALMPGSGDLILGGLFTNIGGVAANRIARYNGNWFALGNGLDNGQCLALYPYNNNMYVGGTFSTIGGVTVNSIARWSGTNWNTVGTGSTGPVKSFGISGTNLIVGGTFLSIGGVNAHDIASWNGTTFALIGTTGLDGGATPSVNAITVWSNILIAGGSFTAATDNNEVAVNNVAGYGAIPVAPTLISPPNASVGISLTPVLDWTDVPNATTYGVQVSLNPNFTTTVINLTLLPASVDTVASGLLINSTTYFWRANAANGLGISPYSPIWFFTTSILGIINNQEIPLQFALHQNFPNPFNPTTKIKFDLPSGMTGKLNLDIFDVNGKLVKNILSTDYAAGKWEVDFDASNLPSGAYFCKITAGEFSAVNKMILVK